jgi:hypothetical protein
VKNILKKMMEILENEEKSWKGDETLNEKLKKLSIEDPSVFQRKIYFRKLLQEQKFIPEFADIITNLQVTQYKIRRITSQIEIFGILSENDFWIKLEDLWKNNVDKLPPYSFAKSIILYLGGCDVPQPYPEEYKCGGLKV